MLSREERDQLINRLVSCGAGAMLDTTEIAENFEQFLIYNNSKHDSYCTNCRSFVKLDKLKLKHREKTLCPSCAGTVTALAEGRGRSRQKEFNNFVSVNVINPDEVVLLAYQVLSKFPDHYCPVMFNQEDGDLEYSYDLTTFYYLSSDGETRRFVRGWERDEEGWSRNWKETRDSEKDPVYLAHESYTFKTYETRSDYIIKYDDIAKLYNTFLKYAVNAWDANFDETNSIVKFLCLYNKHRNVEYLLNGGFAALVAERICDRQTVRINWRNNDLKKMLGLNREEIKYFADNTNFLAKFKKARKMLKGMKLEDFDKIKHLEIENISDVIDKTNISLAKAINYIASSQQRLTEWVDYILMAERLNYDLSDPRIVRPTNLTEMHDRCVSVVNAMNDEIISKNYEKRYEKLKKKYAYKDDELGLTIVVPRGAKDIKEEGRVLRHCVAGYAERHLNGTLNILFIRKIRKPWTSYYTMEVSNSGNIVQCFGYMNNTFYKKPKVIVEFLERYKKFLKNTNKKCERNVS